jgi:hypothetical protein
MHALITRSLAAAAAGIALATLGLAGARPAAAGAVRSLGSPVYTGGSSGYSATGRWFRFVSATVTVPPVTVPVDYGGNMLMELHNNEHPTAAGATILVRPGGGQGSIGWTISDVITPFAMSPRVGDELSLSIYYDQHGHDFFTATDTTQHITRTAQAAAGSVIYDGASLAANFASYGAWPAPAADTRLWEVTSAGLTTYTGTRGTITGPWQTSQMIQTSTGTPAGTVISSPADLWNGGANFGDWLRALPLTYTSGFAGYSDGIGPFRFIATTMTVPPAQVPAANGGTALITLGHNGGPTPRPYADIEVLPGGGAGSLSYTSNEAYGTFTLAPRPGDQLSVSIYYDQHGHYQLTATDTTQATTQAVTVPAPYASSMPLNSAEVLAMFDNSKMTSPPADNQLWQFTGSKVTTYNGDHGSILGVWATSHWTDTTDGTPAGTIVADATVPGNGGQDFSVWLRRR